MQLKTAEIGAVIWGDSLHTVSLDMATSGTRVSLSAIQLQQLLDEITATWYIFCQCLGVPKHKLDQFDLDSRGKCVKCMNAALEWWLKNAENATYEAIIEALESNSVGNRRLAKTFRGMCDKASTVQPPPIESSHPVHTSHSQLSLEDLVDVSTYLLTLKREQVFSLGLVLGLSITSLNPIRDSHLFLDEMLEAWLQGRDRVNQLGGHTWESLVRGLRHPKLNQTEIAKKIEREKVLET